MAAILQTVGITGKTTL